MRLKGKIALLFFFLGMTFLFIYERRQFYCLDNNKCITVWKTLDNNAYIIMGKYYGLFHPTGEYIKTTNTQNLSLYFTNRFPNLVVVRNQGTSEGNEGSFTINNSKKSKIQIINFSNEHRSLFYKDDAVKHNNIISNAFLIELNINENYAFDKSGKKL